MGQVGGRRRRGCWGRRWLVCDFRLRTSIVSISGRLCLLRDLGLGRSIAGRRNVLVLGCRQRGGCPARLFAVIDNEGSLEDGRIRIRRGLSIGRVLGCFLARLLRAGPPRRRLARAGTGNGARPPRWGGRGGRRRRQGCPLASLLLGDGSVDGAFDSLAARPPRSAWRLRTGAARQGRQIKTATPQAF